MIDDGRIHSIASMHLISIGICGILFEAFYFSGFFDESHSWRPMLFNILYTVLLTSIFLSASLLFLHFLTSKNTVFLVISLGIFSWFLGGFFWVSYVFLLGNIVSYPSIIEIVFQGFHLLMIPILFYLVKEKVIQIYKPAYLLIPAISAIPLISWYIDPGSLNVFVYSTFFLFVISLNLVHILHLMKKRVLPLFVIGFLMIVFGDIYFVITYLQEPNRYTFMLDPVWFTGYSLISYSLIHYDTGGKFP